MIVLQDVVTQVTSSQDEEIQSAPSLPQSDVSRDVTMVYNEQHGMSAYPVVGNEVRLPKSDRGGKNPLQRSLSRDSQRSGNYLTQCGDVLKCPCKCIKTARRMY